MKYFFEEADPATDDGAEDNKSIPQDEAEETIKDKK